MREIVIDNHQLSITKISIFKLGDVGITSNLIGLLFLTS